MPTGNLETPVNGSRRTHAGMGRTYKLHTERPQPVGLNPELSFCEAIVALHHRGAII